MLIEFSFQADWWHAQGGYDESGNYGGRPILWHIMKVYSAHGINEFIICLGYKGYMIKEYFANYALHMSDVKIFRRRRNSSWCAAFGTLSSTWFLTCGPARLQLASRLVRSSRLRTEP